MQLTGIAYRTKKREDMIETSSTTVDSNTGVEGDFGRKAGKATVTLLSEEAWQEACREVSTDLHWTVRRANFLVRGFRFSSTDVGRRLQIGSVVFEVTRETDPCNRMEAAQAGLFNALASDWRGGVRAKVITGGNISVGDSGYWLEP